MMLETYVKIVRDRAGFLNAFLTQKWGKRVKTRFFEFTGKFGYHFYLSLFTNENLYYLLCSCTIPIFGKNLVPVVCLRMLSANQIAGFFNQLYL